MYQFQKKTVWASFQNGIASTVNNAGGITSRSLSIGR